MDDNRADFGKKKKVRFFEIFYFSRFQLFFGNCLLFACFSIFIFVTLYPRFSCTASNILTSVGSLDLVLQFSSRLVNLQSMSYYASAISPCRTKHKAFTTTTTTTTITAATATATATIIITGFACALFIYDILYSTFT